MMNSAWAPLQRGRPHPDPPPQGGREQKAALRSPPPRGEGLGVGRGGNPSSYSFCAPHRWFPVMLAVVALLLGGVAAAAETMRIVALGDSLTAGYGLDAEASFPVRLEAALKARGHDVEVINGGVSGDTSRGGLERLDWAVPDGTDAVIVELGANDALRGIEPGVTLANLEAILERLAERDIAVLIAGMRAPPNLGEDYAAAFDAIYPDLARRFDVPLYPFFLEGVAAERKLNQSDGMHPNAAGVEAIVARIIEPVEALIAAAAGDGTSAQ